MSDNKQLAKFFVASALFFIWVVVQGALQSQKPVHDFLGQGPAEMIVGAHVHVGTLGWVSTALLGALYYFVPLVSGKPLSWPRMTNWIFWIFTVSVALMAVALIGAGISGGQAFGRGVIGADLDAVLAPYMILLSLVSIVGGLVSVAFAVQIIHTAVKKSEESSSQVSKVDSLSEPVKV